MRIHYASKVLDTGAGEQQYKRFCAHLNYVSQDFAKYDGKGDGAGLQMESWDQSNLDIISDITSIPEPDASFDAILCVVVFEHLPEPIKAIKEFSRILKKGGRLYLTAPLGCGLHMMPYNYYGGFTPSFYKKYFEEFGIKLISIEPNGGLLKHFLQESNRVAGHVLRYKKYSGFSIRRIIIKFLVTTHL